MSAGILWLASYPKSGNTWFRAFLAALRRGGDGPVDINALGASWACSRALFDEVAGIESSDLTDVEIERLQPRVYTHLAATARERLYLKTHDTLVRTASGSVSIPPAATAGALYIVRNPLDVAVSFAHHEGCDLDTMIARMADPRAALDDDETRLTRNLRQRLGTWSDHVRSWSEAQDIAVHVIRYEDMMGCPVPTFAGAARFCGFADDLDAISRALEACSFAALQRQEREHGFRERSPRTVSFFREGRVGAWREALSLVQRGRLIADHGEMMARFGYLDAEGDGG